MFLFLCVFWSFFESFYRVTGNGHHNINFTFVDLEHAELCLENPIENMTMYAIQIIRSHISILVQARKLIFQRVCLSGIIHKFYKYCHV